MENPDLRLFPGQSRLPPPDLCKTAVSHIEERENRQIAAVIPSQLQRVCHGTSTQITSECWYLTCVGFIFPGRHRASERPAHNADEMAFSAREDSVLHADTFKRLPGPYKMKAVDHYDVHKIVVRAGGMDYENPGCERERYPADYAIRLIDVVVKK